MRGSFFVGVCTAVPTPFYRGKIDFVALGRIIEFQIRGRVDAICILGTTGEAPTIAYDEQVEIIKFAHKAVAGRVKLVFGIGGNNPDVIRRIGRAVSEFAPDAAVMMSAPYYNKCTQDALVRHVFSVANDIKLPMIVYNVPGRTGMNIEPKTIQRIARNKYVVGIKEASGSMAQIIQVVRLCPNVAVYCGDDALALPCYAVGCAGVISVASNVHPRQTRRIFTHHDRRLFLRELPLYAALFCEVNPAPVKFAMSQMGLCCADVRAPLTMLSDENRVALTKLL